MGVKDIKTKRIGVLAGGPSSEREISIKSGDAVYNALIKQGFNAILLDVKNDTENLKKLLKNKGIELAFIALHGSFGEDGTIQQILQEMHIRYTGSGPDASRRALDKLISKEIFKKNKINTPPYKTFKKGQRIEIDELGFPIVIKPRCEGSSIGLSIVREESQLKKALDEAYKYDDTIIVEKYIRGREITVGILKNEPLCVIEVVPGSEFYDYEAKYNRSDTKYLVPAPIRRQDYKKSSDLAKVAHAILDCKGFSRVDMILGDDGAVYVLEVNTIPGLTSRSLLPKAAQYKGISFNKLCKRIIELALE